MNTFSSLLASFTVFLLIKNFNIKQDQMDNDNDGNGVLHAQSFKCFSCSILTHNLLRF